MNHDDQERIVLEIAAKGEPILDIGAWEAPVLHLAQRGLLYKLGHHYLITADGIIAFQEMRRADDAAFARAADGGGAIIDGEVADAAPEDG
jgi:hypothetical protein